MFIVALNSEGLMGPSSETFAKTQLFDASGNVNTCSFDVTVNDTERPEDKEALLVVICPVLPLHVTAVDLLVVCVTVLLLEVVY